MKLIEYEVGSDALKDKDFVEDNNLTMFQVLQLKQGNDIAHSLSILAESSKMVEWRLKPDVEKQQDLQAALQSFETKKRERE